MAKMNTIEKLIWHAAREHKMLGSFIHAGKEESNILSIQDQIAYAPTTPEETVALFADIMGRKPLRGIPVLKAVVLKDKGGFPLYLSEYLSRYTEQKFNITGIEKDKDFVLDAAKIAGQWGVRNVEFSCKDFTKDLTANDLKDKNFFYLNENQKDEDHEKALNDFLPRIPAGAVLVTRYCEHLDVLNSDLFEKKYHPLEDFGEYGQDFTLFIRTTKESIS